MYFVLLGLACPLNNNRSDLMHPHAKEEETQAGVQSPNPMSSIRVTKKVQKHGRSTTEKMKIIENANHSEDLECHKYTEPLMMNNLAEDGEQDRV